MFKPNPFSCELFAYVKQNNIEIWLLEDFQEKIVGYWLIVLESSIIFFLFWETGGSYYISHQKWSELDKKNKKKEIVQSFPTVLILNSTFELHNGIRKNGIVNYTHLDITILYLSAFL